MLSVQPQVHLCRICTGFFYKKVAAFLLTDSLCSLVRTENKELMKYYFHVSFRFDYRKLSTDNTLLQREQVELVKIRMGLILQLKKMEICFTSLAEPLDVFISVDGGGSKGSLLFHCGVKVLEGGLTHFLQDLCTGPLSEVCSDK